MDIITTYAGFEMLLRWGHLLAGVTWIGLLYYFNFVQTEYFKEAEADAKSNAIRKLAPRALWWFRWGAAVTLITGLLIILMRSFALSVDLYIGAILGLLMFLNVWLIIWPNQQIVIKSAETVANGGQALPEAGDALAKAGLASRTNTLFSVPMLFFMGASTHYPHELSFLSFSLILVIIGALEYNAIKGQLGPLATVNGVIGCGFGLAVVLLVILEIM